uniref:CSON005911 protein n=1 Tax=Culicoides sonorensis TaxID=179676 RepID=A0A336LJ03_CULSO
MQLSQLVHLIQFIFLLQVSPNLVYPTFHDPFCNFDLSFVVVVVEPFPCFRSYSLDLHVFHLLTVDYYPHYALAVDDFERDLTVTVIHGSLVVLNFGEFGLVVTFPHYDDDDDLRDFANDPCEPVAVVEDVITIGCGGGWDGSSGFGPFFI